MRFGRILLTLAPLISLTALVNAAPSEPQLSGHNTFIRLLQSVVQLAAPDSDVASAAPAARPSLHAVLDVTALSSTPLRHSLWMLGAFPVVRPFARLQQRALLRC